MSWFAKAVVAFLEIEPADHDRAHECVRLLPTNVPLKAPARRHLQQALDLARQKQAPADLIAAIEKRLSKRGTSLASSASTDLPSPPRSLPHRISGAPGRP